MKNKIILIVAVLAVLIGCEDDAYDAPNTFSDVGFYTGAGQQTILQLNINDYLSFLDLSQGYVEHSWTIEEGNNFLEGPITSRDSIFDHLIIYPGDTVTSDKTAHVLFNKSGYQEVNLHNVYRDSVAFRGYNGESEYTLPAYKQGNYWVIDTTFVVKVFDTIVPEFEIRQFDAVVDHTTTDTIFVEAGDKVQFIDNTTIGEPTGRYWSIKRTLPEGAISTPSDVVASSSAQTADIVFKKLGHFTASVTVNRTGQNLPADYEKHVFTTPFKVIPSSQPFVITNIAKELEDETMQIPFNGEFAPFLNKEDFFEVLVNGIEFPIQSVTINEDDSTVLDIVLVDKIYRPDVITISLLDGSGIESTDTRVPVSFADLPVAMHNVNLLPAAIANIEDGGNQGDDSWKTRWNNSGGLVEFTTDKAASGDWSMKLTMVAGNNNVFADAKLSSPLILDGTKTYLLEYKVFVESSTVLPNESGLFLLQNWGWQMWKNFDYPQGEWKTQTAEYKSGTPLSILWLRILPNGAKTSDIVAYYDDFYMVEKEVRP